MIVVFHILFLEKNRYECGKRKRGDPPTTFTASQEKEEEEEEEKEEEEERKRKTVVDLVEAILKSKYRRARKIVKNDPTIGNRTYRTGTRL